MLPREVSNGLGRGDGAPVLDGAASMLVMALPAEVELALSDVVVVVELAGSVGVAANGTAVKSNGSALSCLC